MDELSYIQGRRSVYLELMRIALAGLSYPDDTEPHNAAWIMERESAINTLRQVCEEFGDNDWSSALHLSDIIDKHLARHLGE